MILLHHHRQTLNQYYNIPQEKELSIKSLDMLYFNPHQIVRIKRNNKRKFITLYFTDRKRQKLCFKSEEDITHFLTTKAYTVGIEWLYYDEK